MGKKICFWIGNGFYILLAFVSAISVLFLGGQLGGTLTLFSIVSSVLLHVGFYLREEKGINFFLVILFVIGYIAINVGIVFINAYCTTTEYTTTIIIAVANFIGFSLAYLYLDFLGRFRYVIFPIFSVVVGVIAIICSIFALIGVMVGGAAEGLAKGPSPYEVQRQQDLEKIEAHKLSIQNGSMFVDTNGHLVKYGDDFWLNGRLVRKGDTYINGDGTNRTYGEDDFKKIDVWKG